MKIADFLNASAIADNLKAKSKNDVLAELTDTIVNTDKSLDRDEVIRVLQEREKLGSTGIGDGVAIPHGKLKNIGNLLICFGRSHDGVDFDSMDGRPAHLFFLLIAPEESVGIHLKTLARISKLLKNKDVRQRLLQADTASDIYSIIIEEEEKL
ncbi:PTS sugar transporter subunit IIA [Desulfuromonas sp. AOP6]|uniref:PTS sugar transporter subunit IIA n=1 Tax=Desulfuromonas sp. AOP6 TaxID=1566351 RepID=UPI001287B14D|nr:PTS sugar transporter subunit IIA [Desulfuromonas sp. AOP6]BCA79551.1 PTS fructose transporter subunit IIA [Desulfuromonas sp. AOP6]